MILTLLPNPALDKTAVINNYELGRIHRPQEVFSLAGGKGFNFARALKNLGEKPLVVCPAGGFDGQKLQTLAAQDGLDCACLPVAAELRTCLTVVDPANGYRLTEIYEKGAPLAPGDWERLLELATGYFSPARYLLVCGSFPPGVPEDGLGGLLARAKKAGLPVLLDTAGPQLKAALAHAPDLVKINLQEATDLLGEEIRSVEEALAAAREIKAAGPRQVVLTLGKTGTAGITEAGKTFAWSAPPVQALSAVGSGDSFLAGLVAGLLKGQALPEAARLGAAAGAANTLQLGAGRFDPAEAYRLLPAVTALPAG